MQPACNYCSHLLQKVLLPTGLAPEYTLYLPKMTIKLQRMPFFGMPRMKGCQPPAGKKNIVTNNANVLVNDEEVMPPDYMWDRICAILDAQEAPQTSTPQPVCYQIAQG
jgi:hypothetical protein